ncbi:hypothetical protein DWX31_10870 [Hungatella hathewayi]|uniref:Uncharacterized protein n=1 Tax=Hungatella hathewayi TaxID=154046 RepID=A0A3E3DN58_9FIRM|nr:hypothetical protein DWX31_10870 [Hungatella hathewayi]
MRAGAEKNTGRTITGSRTTVRGATGSRTAGSRTTVSKTTTSSPTTSSPTTSSPPPRTAITGTNTGRRLILRIHSLKSRAAWRWLP